MQCTSHMAIQLLRPKNASGVAVKFSIRINADEQFEYMEVGARELISELCLLGGSHSGAH